MITTKRLLLRPYVADDWAHVHKYAAAPAFSRFELWGPNSIEDTKRFVGACIASMAATPILGYQLAVILREEAQLIGGCTLKRQSAKDQEAFVGYAIDPDFQSNGYATEATAALIELGFDTLRLDRIYATCDARNIASRRVMEKVGMRLVRVLERHKEVKGTLIDSCEYELRSNRQVRGSQCV